MAYPQQTENIEGLETAGVGPALDSDENLPEEENLGLDDLDSSFDDFLTEDEEDETVAVSSETDESELDLAKFDENLAAEIGLESDDVMEETSGELELDLEFDQDDEADLEMNEGPVAGDELPDLSDFEELAELDEDEGDSELKDFDLELEPEAEAGLGLEGNDGLDLTDMEIEEADELDLTDLELSLDDDTAPEGTADAAPEEVSAVLETGKQAAKKTAVSDLDIEAADELDLSDLDLEIEDASVAVQASDAGAEEEDLNFDLDLDLEAETIAANEDPKTASSDSDVDELDLSDLTDMLEDEKAPAAESQSQELDMELDLETDASNDGDGRAAVTDLEGSDELDVSDLESVVESGPAPAAQTAAEGALQDLEMDLDFQIDGEHQSAETAAVSENEDELDFSDLEQMLESDEGPTLEAADSKDTEEFDLQFDPAGPSAGDENMAAADEISEEVRDDDFLDIEQMLEQGDYDAPSQAKELAGEVTDLPLEMEAALDDASKGAAAELELDFDLESELQEKEDMFDSNETPDQRLESNLLSSEEVDFLEEAGVAETEFQDGSATSNISSAEITSDGFSDTNDAYGATKALPDAEDEHLEEEAFDARPIAKGPKKVRSKKPVLVTLLLFLLALGVIVIPSTLGLKIPYISDIKIPYLSDLDLKIPYLSDWLNPEEQDVAGNLKIVPLGNTINGKFINNSQAGQLFVIQGKIKNDYDHPRSFIKVTGKLYQKGAQVAKQATVYCGNLLSQEDLAALDMTSINRQLRNKTGNERSNFKVETGKIVPFMIVFDKLPSNLDEYTVEVEGSSI
jgi:hypothetical protein